jgi:murein DD-endopeptidase MepM/ murein hydrolase activator NlpD
MALRGRLWKIGKWMFFLLITIGIVLVVLLSYQTEVTNNLDSYVYELPYKKGTSHRVVQGYGGLFSHSHMAAIDFAMPVGTPIYAAREGRVYSYKDDSEKGGSGSSYKNKANYIILQHDDGSFGCYWHLKKDGVLVKKGYVAKGQQIGWSGASGMVIRPHLHFSVKRKLTYEMNSFVRTKFRTSKGITLVNNWKTYERPPD